MTVIKNLFTRTLKTSAPADTDRFALGNGIVAVFNITWLAFKGFLLNSTSNKVPYFNGTKLIDSPIEISGSDVKVPDDAYNSDWNEDLSVPTKNAIYDKIQSIEVDSFKDQSFGESYMNNFKDLAVTDGATYNPNSGGYDISLIKKAGVWFKNSLLMIPSAVKTGVLYSVKPFTNGQFTVIKNSVANFINADGEIEEAAINVARIDYSDEDAVILLEPQRTNLFLNSNVGVTQNITVTSGVEYTVYFFEGTGTITLSDAATEVVSLSDFEYSGAVTFTTTSTTLTCTVAGTANLVQCELGDYATSYIITAGGTVTRLADVINGAGNAALFNSEEGVLYVEIAAFADDLTTRYISLTDGGTSNFITIEFSGITQQIRARLRVGGDTQAELTYTSTDITSFSKIAFKWKVNDFALWIDGVEQGTEVSGFVFPASTLDDLSLSLANTTSYFYGKCKGVQVYNRALTDEELEILTIP